MTRSPPPPKFLPNLGFELVITHKTEAAGSGGVLCAGGVEGWGFGGRFGCSLQSMAVLFLFVLLVFKKKCFLYSLTERRMDVTQPLLKVGISR